MTRALAIALVIASLGAAAPARADRDPASDSVSYRVRQGDTLELIAAEYYGDRRDARLIAVENHMKKPRALSPGERLRIPVTREIVTTQVVRFETLAQTYLGDASRAEDLATFNDLPEDASLPVGTPVSIPIQITHAATEAESLAKVAEEVLGDARQADLLRTYNGLDKPALDKGDSIVVPVLGVHVRAAKLPALDAEARSRRDKQHEVAAAAAAALPRARAAWLEGNFATVQAALAPVADELDYLDDATAIEAGLLLGKAQCAFGQTDKAVARFKQVLERAPRMTLSAYANSPKVLDAWKKAQASGGG